MNEYLLNEHVVLNAHSQVAASLVCTCLVEKLSNMRHTLPEIVICLAGAYVVPAPRAIGTAKTVLDATSEGRPWGFIFRKSI